MLESSPAALVLMISIGLAVLAMFGVLAVFAMLLVYITRSGGPGADE